MSLRPRPPPAAPAGSRLEAALRAGHALRAANVAVINAGLKRKRSEDEALTIAGLKREQFEGKGDPGAGDGPENKAARLARLKWQQEEGKEEEGKEAEIEAVGRASRELGFDFSSQSQHSLFTIEAATIEAAPLEAATIEADTEYRNVLGTLVNKIVIDIKKRWGIASYMNTPMDLMYAYEDLLGNAMTARAGDLLGFAKMLARELNPIRAWSAGRLLLRNLELGDESAALASLMRARMDDAAANAGFDVKDEVYLYTGVFANNDPLKAFEDGSPDYFWPYYGWPNHS